MTRYGKGNQITDKKHDTVNNGKQDGKDEATGARLMAPNYARNQVEHAQQPLYGQQTGHQQQQQMRFSQNHMATRMPMCMSGSAGMTSTSSVPKQQNQNV